MVILKSAESREVALFFSCKGTAQGCPLAMLAYSIGVLPLIRSLKDPRVYTQSWYTDDSSCGGRLQHIHSWLLKLLELGPSYGYFAELTKSTVIVKEEYRSQAEALFADLDVKITLAGHFLGGLIGDKDVKRQLLRGKIEHWIAAAESLPSCDRLSSSSLCSIHALPVNGVDVPPTRFPWLR